MDNNDLRLWKAGFDLGFISKLKNLGVIAENFEVPMKDGIIKGKEVYAVLEKTGKFNVSNSVETAGTKT